MPRGLFIVCDGMGGHAGGEVASALAINVLRDRLGGFLSAHWPTDRGAARTLHEVVLVANRAVFEENERAGRAGRERTGTTLALLFLSGSMAWVVHVGDSRIYRVTREQTTLLTTDHNVANREIRRGTPAEEAWSRADARHLTQALGPAADDQVHPDIQCLPVTEDSLFLLCTDGLSDQAFIERYERELLRPLVAPEADLSLGCGRLLEMANQVNGHDNLTALLIRVGGFGKGASASAAERARSPGRGMTRVAGNWLSRLVRRRRV